MDRACPRCGSRPLRLCHRQDASCLHCDACDWCGDPRYDRPRSNVVAPTSTCGGRKPTAPVVKDPGEFAAALRDALTVLRGTGRSAWDIFGDDGTSDHERTPALQRARAFVEGAAASLAVTPIELLDEYGLLSAVNDD